MNDIGFKTTLLLIVSGACFASAIVAPCLPLITKHFNVDNFMTYHFVSAFLFGYLIGQIFYSLVAQIKGYRKSLLIGFSIYFIGSMFQIISIQNNSIDFFMCSRFFSAFGASSGLICSFALINDKSIVIKKSQKLISMAFISLTLFSYVSITLGGFITEYLGSIYIFYLILITSLAQLFLIFNYIPEQQDKNLGKPNFKYIVAKYVRALYNPKLLSSSLIIAFTTTSTYLYNAVGSTISMNIFHLTPKYFGILSILNLIGLISGGWLSSKMMRRYSALKVVSRGIFLTFIPVSMFFIFHFLVFKIDTNGFFFYLLIIFLNIGLGLIYPAASFVALNSIECNSTASSIMNLIKIGCPALTISSFGYFHVELIESYRIPLLLLFFVAILCLSILKINSQRENA